MSNPESEPNFAAPNLDESTQELEEMARNQMDAIRAEQERDLSPEVGGDYLEAAAMQVVDESEVDLEETSRGLSTGVKTGLKYFTTGLVGGFAIGVVEALARSRGIHVPTEFDGEHMDELLAVGLALKYVKGRSKRNVINDQQSDSPEMEPMNE
jgi:hypothetical protein